MGPKKESIKKNEVEDKVVNYINKINKPFTSQQIEKEFPMIGKTQCVKLLKQLADQGRITSNEYGKTILYWKNQKDEDEELDDYGQPLNGPKPTVEDLNRTNASLSSQQNELAEEFKKTQIESRKLEAQLTNDQIEEMINKLTKENQELETKLNGYKKKNVSASPDAKKKLEAQHAKTRREWIKRKTLFKDIIEAIIDRTNKKRKDLKEKIGWEDDEDFNVTMIEDRTKTDRDQKRVKR